MSVALLVKRSRACFKERISFLPALDVCRCYFGENHAATLVCRRYRLYWFLKPASPSRAPERVYALVTQKGCSYRFHNEIYFLGLTGNIIRENS